MASSRVTTFVVGVFFLAAASGSRAQEIRGSEEDEEDRASSVFRLYVENASSQEYISASLVNVTDDVYDKGEVRAKRTVIPRGERRLMRSFGARGSRSELFIFAVHPCRKTGKYVVERGSTRKIFVKWMKEEDFPVCPVIRIIRITDQDLTALSEIRNMDRLEWDQFHIDRKGRVTRVGKDSYGPDWRNVWEEIGGDYLLRMISPAGPTSDRRYRFTSDGQWELVDGTTEPRAPSKN